MRTPKRKEERVLRPREQSVFGGAACGCEHRCDLWLTGQSDEAPEHGVCYEVAMGSVEWFLSRCVAVVPDPLLWRNAWPLPAGRNAIGRWWYAAHGRADKMPVLSSECFPPPDLVPDPEAFIGLALRRETAEGAFWLLGLMHEEYERVEVTLLDGTPEWMGFGRGFPFVGSVVVRESVLVPDTPSPRLGRMHWREPAPESIVRPEAFTPVEAGSLPEPLQAVGKWFAKKLLGKRLHGPEPGTMSYFPTPKSLLAAVRSRVFSAWRESDYPSADALAGWLPYSRITLMRAATEHFGGWQALLDALAQEDGAPPPVNWRQAKAGREL